MSEQNILGQESDFNTVRSVCSLNQTCECSNVHIYATRTQLVGTTVGLCLQKTFSLLALFPYQPWQLSLFYDVSSQSIILAVRRQVHEIRHTSYELHLRAFLFRSCTFSPMWAFTKSLPCLHCVKMFPSSQDTADHLPLTVEPCGFSCPVSQDCKTPAQINAGSKSGRNKTEHAAISSSRCRGEAA